VVDRDSSAQETFSLYVTWKFITGLTKASHWTLSLSSSAQFTYSQTISLISILLLSSHPYIYGTETARVQMGKLGSSQPTELLYELFEWSLYKFK